MSFSHRVTLIYVSNKVTHLILSYYITLVLHCPIIIQLFIQFLHDDFLLSLTVPTFI